MIWVGSSALQPVCTSTDPLWDIDHTIRQNDTSPRQLALQSRSLFANISRWGDNPHQSCTHSLMVETASSRMAICPRPIRVETPPTPSELRRFLSRIHSFERQARFQLPEFTHISRLAQEGSEWIWTKRAVLEIAYLGIATGIWYRGGLPGEPGVISEAPVLMAGSNPSGAPPIVPHPMPLTRRGPPNAVELEAARIVRYRVGDFRIMEDAVPLNYFDEDLNFG